MRIRSECLCDIRVRPTIEAVIKKSIKHWGRADICRQVRMPPVAVTTISLANYFPPAAPDYGTTEVVTHKQDYGSGRRNTYSPNVFHPRVGYSSEWVGPFYTKTTILYLDNHSMLNVRARQSLLVARATQLARKRPPDSEDRDDPGDDAGDDAGDGEPIEPAEPPTQPAPASRQSPGHRNEPEYLPELGEELGEMGEAGSGHIVDHDHRSRPPVRAATRQRRSKHARRRAAGLVNQRTPGSESHWPPAKAAASPLHLAFPWDRDRCGMPRQQ